MAEPTSIEILVLACVTVVSFVMMLKLIQIAPVDGERKSTMPEIHAEKRKHRKMRNVRPAVAKQFEGW